MSNQRLSTGDEINGFTLVEINKLSEYLGIGYLFKHIATGMEVYHVENDDKELFFSYIFNTIPSNNSGVAHIIEHSVLAGSKKYPLRDPFIALQKGSANTFMNAMTFPTKTLYPAASPLEKDFDNIFSVYSDAVFSPLLREETFMQEGIRLTLDEEGNFAYKGVVFNEMLGDRNDADYQTNLSCFRLLFPDTPYSYNSGGEPLDILDLNFTKFKAFYDQYYHPSNCKLFLYGDLNVSKYLKLIDKEYLKSYAKLKITPSKLTADRWDEPRHTTISIPSSDENAKRTVALSFATTDSSNSLEVITLAFIYELLLGSTGCPLYKKMLNSDIGEEVSNVSGVSSDYNLMPLIIAFSGVKEGFSSTNVEKFLMDSLKEIATSGFDEELVKATLKRITFQIQEKPDRGPVGYSALTRAMRGWLRGKTPASTIEYSKSVDLLKHKMEDDTSYLSTWITKNLINNSHRLLLTAEPNHKSVDEYQEKLAKKLRERTDTLNEEQRSKLNVKTLAYEEFQHLGDSEESVNTIPKLSIDDLPKSIRNIEHTGITDLKVPVWKAIMETNKIVYFDYAIHVEDFSQRELLLLPLYTKILERCGVDDMDSTKVMTEIMNNTGGFNLILEGGSDLNGDRVNCFLGRVKMLEADVSAALKLTYNIILNAHVDDYKDIWESVISFKEIYKSVASNYGYRFATLAASSPFSENGKVMEDTVGVSQWLFLNSIKREDIGSLALELKAMQEKLNNRRRFEVHITCEKSEMKQALEEVHTFLKVFPLKEIIVKNTINYQLIDGPFDSKAAYVVPASVNHTSYVIPASALGTSDNAAERVLASILSGNDLWNDIRVRGGAYGVDCNLDSLEKLFVFISASDPNLASTFEAFKRGLKKYSENDISEDKIADAIISNVANDLKPYGPSTTAIIDFRRILFKINNDVREKAREFILKVDDNEIKRVAKALNASDRVSSVIFADPSALEKDRLKLLFEGVQAISLPL
ncbi:MAG: insulinase family protein [Spirochaetaceae bacterium]|nr:insulinase family protein [Spirochaetaceae bacterium]